jgi:RHS repeat-associated protein
VSSSGTQLEKGGTLTSIPMNASSTARFDSEPQECAFGAGFRPSNLGIEWNAENQLTEVLENAVSVAAFAYDPLGRRVEKVEDSTTTTFIYDFEDIIRTTTGATTSYYIQGPGVDEPLAKEVSGSTTYYHADALGSILRLTDVTGDVVSEYRYDSWGRIETGSDPEYAFAGREWDSELAAYYYRNRYYDPSQGRFLSEDPIGLAGGWNLFRYADGNPTNLFDPFGLEVVNNSPNTIWVKPELTGEAVPVAPGETYHDRQDGLALTDDGKDWVFKTVDNIDAKVTQDGLVVTHGGSIQEKIGQLVKGGWKGRDWLKEQQKKGDHGWDDLFEKGKPVNDNENDPC